MAQLTVNITRTIPSMILPPKCTLIHLFTIRRSTNPPSINEMQFQIPISSITTETIRKIPRTYTNPILALHGGKFIRSVCEWHKRSGKQHITRTYTRVNTRAHACSHTHKITHTQVNVLNELFSRMADRQIKEDSSQVVAFEITHHHHTHINESKLGTNLPEYSYAYTKIKN